MQRIVSRGCCLTAFAAVALGMPAAASPVSTAVIRDLQFALIDLDPNDAVAPSLSWSSASSFTQAARDFSQIVSLVPQPGGSPHWSVSYGQNAADSAQGTTAVFEPLASAVQGANAQVGATDLHAAAAADPGGASVFSLAFTSGEFILSAHTELQVSANLAAAAAGPSSAGFTGPPGVAQDIGVPFSQASAYAELFLFNTSALDTAGGISYVASSNPASFPVDAYSDVHGLQAVELNYRNDTDDLGFGGFYALVQTSASELEQLRVPEPPPVLLMAIGLLAATFVGARRRA